MCAYKCSQHYGREGTHYSYRQNLAEHGSCSKLLLQGFIGSNEQMEYTVIGDTVNRTSRYCNGAGRGEIVISPEVYRRVQGIVEAQPKTILAKYPGIEDAMEAYLVSGFGT